MECKMLILSNLVTLACCLVLAKHYNLLRDIRVKLGYEEKLPDNYWAVNGWNNTIEKLDYQCDVVFFGNSITCMSDFRPYFPNSRIVTCGYPGDGLGGMLMRIPSLRYIHPKAVFAMGGINDLSNLSLENFEKLYTDFGNMLLDSIPEAEIYLQSILPINTEMKPDMKKSSDKIIRANTIIRKFADSHDRCHYVDLFSLYEQDGLMPRELTRDGVHLFSKSYDRWAEAIRPFMEQYTEN